jgi:hypothetical protein
MVAFVAEIVGLIGWSSTFGYDCQGTLVSHLLSPAIPNSSDKGELLT